MNRSRLLTATIVFLLTACSLFCKAQVCKGSLGDPVVNIDFGSGTGTGAPLKAATTKYYFTSSSCPNDGYYTVTGSSFGCFGNSWQSVSQDHTPNDNNGYMMLINASFEPNDFYLDTVKNLCANTTYEFAAWVMNVLLPSACDGNGIQPNLVFNVESPTGTVLGTYSTGNIPSSSSPEWKQYGLFFTTPVNTNSVVIRLKNTAVGGCGNDLALDDITFRPCGPEVTASVVNNNQVNADLCSGSVLNIPMMASIGSGYVSPALQWQLSSDSGTTWTDIAGATTLNYRFDRTAKGTYKYRLTVSEGSNAGIASCRVASNIVNITVHDPPAISATSNSPVCENALISLVGAGGASYTWTGPAGFTADSPSPTLTAQSNSAGVYNVKGTDQFGCVSNAVVNVVTNPAPTASVSANITICEGTSLQLLAAGGLAYSWFPATGLSAAEIANPVAQPSETTVYNVSVSAANGCADTATMTLTVVHKPTADAGPDQVLLKGQSVILQGVVGGADVNISWSPGVYLDNTNIARPLAKPISDIVYTLNVVSAAGCGAASDEVQVKVYNDIYIPTAFSPNNDGLNDTWRIDGLAAAPNARVLVFDRFGDKVFETTGNNEQWDGTYKGQPVSPGAYAYLIDLKNGLPLRKGTVMVLR